ncbi:hypothetical protein EVG20_g10714 [Dentipellis fragilis]|uniref:Uncharacterized protein n=1 Tax=Dentipellis fragilis TaxID=205917 RepID=A0A4Y9XPM3_9AGAM|nr:hypothetical protein EVG20_g10714 [Dentipellis fragilis]
MSRARAVQTYPLVLVQYRSPSQEYGDERKFEWALQVQVDKRRLKGPIFRVIDMDGTFSESGAWWMYVMEDGTLRYDPLCYGGIQIGEIHPLGLNRLREVIQGHQLVPKRGSWRSRHWALEVMEILKGHGWIRHDLVPRRLEKGMFLPEFRRLSRVRVSSPEGENAPYPPVTFY